MNNKDLTNKIERMTEFESRLGVALSALSAFVEFDEDEDLGGDSVCVSLCGELSANSGKNLKDSLSVEVAVYDKAGRVVGKDAAYFDSDAFFGFEAFSVDIYIPVKDISKIRVYPKK